jgi:hypothetical protein
MTTVIDSRDALDALPPFLWKRGVPPLLLDVPRAPAERVASVSERLNRHYFACGCEVGSFALACALIVWGLRAATAGDGARRFLTARIGAVVSSLAAAAAAGKMIGLSVAWLNYRRARREAAQLLAIMG